MSISTSTHDNFGAIPSIPLFHQRIDVVLDNSYPTGGYALGLAALVGGGKTIAHVQCEGVVTSTGAPDLGRRYVYNETSGKLMAVTITTSPAEVANATDLSTITVKVFVHAY